MPQDVIVGAATESEYKEINLYPDGNMFDYYPLHQGKSNYLKLGQYQKDLVDFYTLEQSKLTTVYRELPESRSREVFSAPGTPTWAKTNKGVRAFKERCSSDACVELLHNKFRGDPEFKSYVARSKLPVGSTDDVSSIKHEGRVEPSLSYKKTV